MSKLASSDVLGDWSGDLKTFSCQIEVGDPWAQRFELLDAVVDAGARYSVIPTPVLQRLGVEPIEHAELWATDGQNAQQDVGQTWIRINGRAVIRLVVFGLEEAVAIVGTDVLEGLRLGVDGTNRRLIPTPASPI